MGSFSNRNCCYSAGITTSSRGFFAISLGWASRERRSWCARTCQGLGRVFTLSSSGSDCCSRFPPLSPRRREEALPSVSLSLSLFFSPENSPASVRWRLWCTPHHSPTVSPPPLPRFYLHVPFSLLVPLSRRDKLLPIIAERDKKTNTRCCFRAVLDLCVVPRNRWGVWLIANKCCVLSCYLHA